MRADGRRLGRIIGQLDDIEVLLHEYAKSKDYPAETISGYLTEAWNACQATREHVEVAVRLINKYNAEKEGR